MSVARGGEKEALVAWWFCAAIHSVAAHLFFASLVALLVKDLPAMQETACSAEDSVLIPGLGGSPGEGSVSPLQYSCLENSVDREAWRAAVHGFARVTQLSNYHPEMCPVLTYCGNWCIFLLVAAIGHILIVQSVLRYQMTLGINSECCSGKLILTFKQCLTFFFFPIQTKCYTCLTT